MAGVRAGYALVRVRLLDAETRETFLYQAYRNAYLKVGSEYVCCHNGNPDTRVEVTELDVSPDELRAGAGEPGTLYYPKIKAR